jgi:hypothetical protein
MKNKQLLLECIKNIIRTEFKKNILNLKTNSNASTINLFSATLVDFEDSLKF